MKMAIFADGRLRVDDDSYPWDVRARRGYSGSCEQASGAPDMVEVSLLLTFSMGEEQRKDFEPIALGSLESHPDKITASLGIPADVLSPILQMLIAARFKFILITGGKFRYRSARLQGFRLEMKLAEDDMLAAEGDAT